MRVSLSCVFFQYFVSPLNLIYAAIHTKVDAQIALKEVRVSAMPQPIHVLVYTVILAYHYLASVFNGHGLSIQWLKGFGFHFVVLFFFGRCKTSTPLPHVEQYLLAIITASSGLAPIASAPIA